MHPQVFHIRHLILSYRILTRSTTRPEHLACFQTLQSLKKELTDRGISIDTPGLKGDERAAELASRLRKDMEKLESEAKQAEREKTQMTLLQEKALRVATRNDCSNVLLLRDLDSALVRKQFTQIEECILAGADADYESQVG